MAERYTKLYKTPSDLYTKGSPVLCQAGALLLDTLNAKVLSQVKFQSIAQKKIIALSVALQPESIAGAPLGDAIVHTYLDLSVERDENFGSQTPLYLPDAESRAFTVSITKVEFEDHSTWEPNEAKWEPLVIPSRPLPEALQSETAVEAYQRRFGADASHLPEIVSDLWRCSCGALNHCDEEACHRCAARLQEMRSVDVKELEQGHTYFQALSLMECGTDDSLKQAIELFTSLGDYKDSAEKKTACEALIIQYQGRRKKIKKISIIAAYIFAGIAACLATLFFGIIPSVQISKATALVEAEKYAEAMLYLQRSSLAGNFRSDQFYAIKHDIENRTTEEVWALIDQGKYQEAYDLMTDRHYTWGDTYLLVSTLKDGNYHKAIGVYGVTHITLPEGVTSIGKSAFSHCDGLTSITIPSSVTSIGSFAFYECDSLETVYYGGTASQWSKISFNSYNGCLTAATRYYYSAEAPTTSGNYWHYDQNGKVAI